MLRVLINTFKILMKKKSFFIVSMIIPAILIIVFSYALGQESTYRVGIVNKDKGIISEVVLDKIEAIEGIKIQNIDEEETENLIAAKELELAIIINENFTENIISGVHDTIEIKSVTENDVKPVIKEVLDSEIDNLHWLSKIANGDEVKFKELQEKYKENMPEYKVNDNEEKNISVMNSLGIIIMMILISGQVVTRFIIEDEINGTKNRALLSGISEKSYYGGIFIVFYLCSAITSVIYYTICKVLGFNFGLDNSIYFLGVLLAINLLAVTFNLCIVSFVKKPNLASNVAIIFIVPTTMLGGGFWPFEMMPNYMQKIGNLTPQRWAIGSLEKLQSGAPLSEALPMILAILILSLILFLLSIFFSKRVSNGKY